MTDVQFQDQLRAIVEHAPPTVHDQFQQTIDRVTSYGVDSYAALLTVVQDATVDTEIRVAACWLLGQLRSKRAVYALLRAFDSAQDQLRSQAAHALGQIGSKAAVKPLLSVLQPGSTAGQRADAVYALGQIGDVRAIEPLLRVLSDRQEDARVRGQAAEALAYLPDRAPAVRAALTTALSDPSVEVRFWAAFALGQIGDISDHAAIQALEQLAASDTTTMCGWWSVQQEATDALQHIKDRSDAVLEGSA